jgi:hypothetical protein
LVGWINVRKENSVEKLVVSFVLVHMAQLFPTGYTIEGSAGVCLLAFLFAHVCGCVSSMRQNENTTLPFLVVN